jgi:hypothetical protein
MTTSDEPELFTIPETNELTAKLDALALPPKVMEHLIPPLMEILSKCAGEQCLPGVIRNLYVDAVVTYFDSLGREGVSFLDSTAHDPDHAAILGVIMDGSRSAGAIAIDLRVELAALRAEGSEQLSRLRRLKANTNTVL